MSTFKDDLSKYGENLRKNLKSQDSEEMGKDLTSNNKCYNQLEKELAAYDLIHDKSPSSQRSDMYYSGMEKLIKKIDDAVGKLVVDVERAVVRDKNRTKGEKSQTYRHLKVFIADIKSLAPAIAQEVKFELEQQKVETEGIRKTVESQERQMKNALVTLRQLGTNLEAGIAHTARFCKTMNATPNAIEWNRNIATDQGIRKVSQPLTNVVRYCYTSLQELDRLDQENQKLGKASNIVDIAVNPSIHAQIKRLREFLKNDAAKIQQLGGVSGKTPFDGSIGFLGNQKEALLPNNATEEEVRRAVKHVHNLLKEVVPIAKKLKEFEA